MQAPDKIPLRSLFDQSPIVPAIRRPEHLDAALAAHGRVVFFLSGTIESCREMFQKARSAGKLPFANLDLIQGLSRDKHAASFLRGCGAAGIISTHTDTLRHVLSLGLYAVQRTFLVDSGAMETISSQLKNTPVDALEVLPAIVAPRMAERVRAISPHTLLMGGGLIANMKELESLLQHGLEAVSIGDPQMWIG